jgi:hypothetical protein
MSLLPSSPSWRGNTSVSLTSPYFRSREDDGFFFSSAAIPVMADAALAALRAATRECAVTAGRFSPEQIAEAAGLANELQANFSSSTAAAATAELRVERPAPSPLLLQLPSELIVEVLQHLDARSLTYLACTC